MGDKSDHIFAQHTRLKKTAWDGQRERSMRVVYLAPGELKPDPDNPRKHGRQQIRALARSMEAFDFRRRATLTLRRCPPPATSRVPPLRVSLPAPGARAPADGSGRRR